MVGSKIPSFDQMASTSENEEKVASCKTAYDFYKLFSTDDWVDEVVYQSRFVIFFPLLFPSLYHLFLRLYAVQKGFMKKIDLLNLDSFRCLEGFLLHTGYHSVPRRRMVWERMLDCHNPLISDNIRRDTVDYWVQCLHFR